MSSDPRVSNRIKALAGTEFIVTIVNNNTTVVTAAQRPQLPM